MDIFHIWMASFILFLALHIWTLQLRIKTLKGWADYGKEEFREQSKALESKLAGLEAAS